jgi:hypothetical protein
LFVRSGSVGVPGTVLEAPVVSVELERMLVLLPGEMRATFPGSSTGDDTDCRVVTTAGVGPPHFFRRSRHRTRIP